MNYKSIADMYAANERVRRDLKELLSAVTDERAAATADGEKWTIAQLVEHIAMVDEGTARICAKLMGKAREAGLPASDSLNVSDDFIKKAGEIRDVKVEAPERVHPTGEFTIAASLDRMDENRLRFNDLRPLFEQFDGDTAKFPHPYFGDISAVEWLIMLGAHEARHTEQIRKRLNSSN